MVGIDFEVVDMALDLDIEVGIEVEVVGIALDFDIVHHS